LLHLAFTDQLILVFPADPLRWLRSLESSHNAACTALPTSSCAASAARSLIVRICVAGAQFEEEEEENEPGTRYLSSDAPPLDDDEEVSFIHEKTVIEYQICPLNLQAALHRLRTITAAMYQHPCAPHRQRLCPADVLPHCGGRGVAVRAAAPD